jgi:small subunit ribosomal protein S6
MRIYEEFFIVRTSTPEEEVDALLEQLTAVIAGAGGLVEKTEKWGTRKLAYRINKQSEGSYVLVQFSAGPQAVKEIERRLRVSDAVLKFLTVRIDEKLKRVEKRKKLREKRAARKPAMVPPAAAPSMPVPEQPVTEQVE